MGDYKLADKKQRQVQNNKKTGKPGQVCPINGGLVFKFFI